jgi:hypothetical protein
MKRPTIDDLRVIGGPDLADTIIQNRRETSWGQSVFNCCSAVRFPIAPSFGVVGSCPLLGV